MNTFDSERLALLLRGRPGTNLNEHFNYWLGVFRKRVDPDFSFGEALPLVNRQVVKAGWRKWEKANGIKH